MKHYGDFTREQKDALWVLLSYKGRMSTQEFKTLKGQIYANDVAGFNKGLEKVLARKEQI